MKTNFTMMLLSLGLLLACGQGSNNKYGGQTNKGSRQYSSTNPVFTPYVQEFERLAGMYTHTHNFSVGDVPINFGETSEEKYQGVCRIYANGSKEILVRQAWWGQATQAAKESLIFHELGHCRLGRDHDQKTMAVRGNDVKLSLMHSELIHHDLYKAFRNDYLIELFTNNKGPVINKIQEVTGEPVGMY